jgi:hypothetical protein
VRGPCGEQIFNNCNRNRAAPGGRDPVITLQQRLWTQTDSNQKEATGRLLGTLEWASLECVCDGNMYHRSPLLFAFARSSTYIPDNGGGGGGGGKRFYLQYPNVQTNGMFIYSEGEIYLFLRRKSKA